VPFYGYLRQYHNIRAEIDGKIHEVLESGQYVMGPMLKRFQGSWRSSMEPGMPSEWGMERRAFADV
jgi:dTDP-4-amino-4,6-dideoxygalactose transaminase